MAQRINDRFTSNRIALLQNHGRQHTNAAFDYRLEASVARLGCFVRDLLEGRGQVSKRFYGGAQITNAISSFRQDLVRVI